MNLRPNQKHMKKAAAPETGDYVLGVTVPEKKFRRVVYRSEIYQCASQEPVPAFQDTKIINVRMFENRADQS